MPTTQTSWQFLADKFTASKAPRVISWTLGGYFPGQVVSFDVTPCAETGFFGVARIAGRKLANDPSCPAELASEVDDLRRWLLFLRCRFPGEIIPVTTVDEKTGDARGEYTVGRIQDPLRLSAELCQELADKVTLAALGEADDDPATGRGNGGATAAELLQLKEACELLPEMFPSVKVLRGFLESHPEVTREKRDDRRGGPVFVDLNGLVRAKMKERPIVPSDEDTEALRQGVTRRKADIDAKRLGAKNRLD